jgi:hypothetical protein
LLVKVQRGVQVTLGAPVTLVVVVVGAVRRPCPLLVDLFREGPGALAAAVRRGVMPKYHLAKIKTPALRAAAVTPAQQVMQVQQALRLLYLV